MILLIAAFVLFIIIFACRLLKLKLLLRLQYDAGGNGIRLAAMLFNIRIIDYEFTVETDERDKLIIRLYKRNKLRETYTLETLIHKLKLLTEDYKKSFDLVEKKLLVTVKGFLSKRAKIEDLSLQVKLGLTDAFSTAMTLGAVYAAVNTLLGRLYAKKKPKKAAVDIRPDFQKPVFELFFSIALTIRISSLSLIVTAVLFLFLKNKAKKEHIKNKTRL